MKELPITFKPDMIQAIHEGRKTVTRRIINENGLLTVILNDNGCYVINSEFKNFKNGKLNFETNTNIGLQRLHGWERWKNLFEQEIQEMWRQKKRGILSFKRMSNRKGWIFRCDIILFKEKNIKIYPPFSLHVLPRNSYRKVDSNKTSGRKPSKQQTGESLLGDSKRELGRSKSSRELDKRRESSNVKTIRQGKGTYSVGSKKWDSITKAYCKDVGDVTIKYKYDLQKVNLIRLWVKEPFKIIGWGHGAWVIFYKDGAQKEIFGNLFKGKNLDQEWIEKLDKRKKLGTANSFISSQFCPANAARLWMEVTDVWAECLQDITEKECIREGIEVKDGVLFKDYLNKNTWFINPRDSFKSLWNSIHTDPKHQWDANPWDWRYGIKRIEKHN